LPPPFLHIVLHEPEIPNNTGNIGRTCIATGCALHLIRPLGFDTSEKACRRAGLDYWPRLNPLEHNSFQDYSTYADGNAGGIGQSRRWLFSTKTTRPIWEADFRLGDHLIFGKETAGLPTPMLDAHPGRILALPMVPGERSLNLATAVCAGIYEALRQMVVRGDLTIDDSGHIVARQSPIEPLE
jgi:tRNA (cytidine/uridine-2'-O-)-methyltransferase